MAMKAADIVGRVMRQLRTPPAGVWFLPAEFGEIIVCSDHPVGRSEIACAPPPGSLDSLALPEWAADSTGSGAGGDNGDGSAFHDLIVQGWIRVRAADWAKETVDGDKQVNVTGDQYILVQGDSTETYGENLTIALDGNLDVTCSQGMLVNLGQSTAMLDANGNPTSVASGTQGAVLLGCSKYVSGTAARTVASSAVQQFDGDVEFTVAGNHTETVWGDSNVTIEGDYTQNVDGDYTVTCDYDDGSADSQNTTTTDSYAVTGNFTVKVDGQITYKQGGATTSYYSMYKTLTLGQKYTQYIMSQSLELDLGFINKIYVTLQVTVVLPIGGAVIVQAVPLDASYKTAKYDIGFGPNGKALSAIFQNDVAYKEAGVGQGKLDAIWSKIHGLGNKKGIVSYA